MTSRLSIGVVTYAARFEPYFKPLVRQLHAAFPDYDIIVFINGHYDAPMQIAYLREVTSFLRGYPEIRYVTHEQHQPLARGWNWLAMMAESDRVLILNDDVTVRPLFRYELERLRSMPVFFMINNSWSHFCITKALIRRVGWFDERFVGVGDEDGDYMCRLAHEGVPIANVPMRGIGNIIAAQDNAGWRNLSGLVNGKYAQVNRQVFIEKWYHSQFEPVPDDGSFVLRYKDEEYRVALKEPAGSMPQFYPMDVLDRAQRGPARPTLGDHIAKWIGHADHCVDLARRGCGALLRRGE